MTEILDITVTMPESKLSAEVANNIVESLDEYVQTVRKSNAIDRRLYLERRNSQIEDSLRNNEEALKTFQIQNKIIEQSPELVLQQSRLMRNVELYQATNIQINQQLEIARIDEIKDNPIINLKEKAKDPVVRSGPPRRNYFIFLIILVGISATSYFVYRDQLKEYFNIVKTELKK
jgi:capsule polysaccharide export protein KpsE/RkpR